MPRRRAAYRRVTPLASRRETQRRAAMAVLSLVAVVGGLGRGVVCVRRPEPAARDRVAQRRPGGAATRPGRTSPRSSGPGIDLVATTSREALDLLTEAYAALDDRRAGQRSSPADDRAAARAEVDAGLDRLYGVVPVDLATLFTSPGRRAKASTSARWSWARTARRSSSTQRRRRSTGSTCRRKQGVGVFREGTKAAGSDRRRAEAPGASAGATC